MCFSGVKGNYIEDDIPDPIDFYGRTKLVGEVNYGNVLTIRTSFIGHQINSKYGLLEWFLTQKDNCKGFVNAIYSGLPTIEIAKILNDHIIFNKKLIGLYQISGNAINKYELLSLINKIYGLKLNIEKEHEVKIDRSLNSKKFEDATGYKPPNWESLIKKCMNIEDFQMFKSKKLLITGGTGSFGTTVVKRWLKTDIEEIRFFLEMKNKKI